MATEGLADWNESGGGLFRDWGGGQEIVAEAGGIGIEEFGDALGIGGAEDEAGVMFFGDALDDFGVSVGAGIRNFLTRERKHYAGVFAAAFRQDVRNLAGGNFNARPFAPEIDASGGFDGIGDIGAADARGNFDEIEFSILVGAKKFGMRYSANQPQRRDQFPI